ncbi:DNA adenine methylase [Halomonas sp. 18H]|nr:DNA adenine methylase [Halomonas sp. 18H]MCW4151994.1 DNA adenine methylase [Halomonas sp. 18H]
MLSSQSFASYVKYMGSKSKIIDFVINGINEVRNEEEPILDLFSGSASLAGAIGRQTEIRSNDIQVFSSIIASAYTNAWFSDISPDAEKILKKARAEVSRNRPAIVGHEVNYKEPMKLEEFVKCEEKQRELINYSYTHEWHLFLKNYSGTWWSAEQCLWIDAIRKVAEEYVNDPVYPVILSSLMFAMAYSSQGTGHYAQYRDATTLSSMKDISIYRSRDVEKYFFRKYQEAILSLPRQPNPFRSMATSLDYRDSLTDFHNGVIYADPPYCFVHYSRFYHALETLILYDFPELQYKGEKIVKGRYRAQRHQSPFSIKSKVNGAFEDLFQGVVNSGSNLVLSYSNTGMITLDELGELAGDIFQGKSIELLSMDYQHMTLGRQGIRHRDVKECLLLVKN